MRGTLSLPLCTRRPKSYLLEPSQDGLKVFRPSQLPLATLTLEECAQKQPLDNDLSLESGGIILPDATYYDPDDDKVYQVQRKKK
jgi:hypothetical protein